MESNIFSPPSSPRINTLVPIINSTQTSTQDVNEEARKALEEKKKRQEYNKKYYVKNKSAAQTVKQLETTLNQPNLEPGQIVSVITQKDRLNQELQNENHLLKLQIQQLQSQNQPQNGFSQLKDEMSQQLKQQSAQYQQIMSQFQDLSLKFNLDLQNQQLTQQNTSLQNDLNNLKIYQGILNDFRTIYPHLFNSVLYDLKQLPPSYQLSPETSNYLKTSTNNIINPINLIPNRIQMPNTSAK
jgi:hypothetical protein